MHVRLGLLFPLVAASLSSGEPGREVGPWWEAVKADIAQFKRPITDARAASRPGDRPVARGDRVFCPHDDRSPLRSRYLSASPDPRIADQLVESAYYCEIEQVYWVHVQGGIAGLNLVTGPYRLGQGVRQTQPAAPSATRPAADALHLRLERQDDRPLVAGAPVPIALVFTNASDAPIWINANQADATVEVGVVGPRVERLPREGGGEPLKAADFVRLEPHGLHRIDLPDLIGARVRSRLTLGGRYLIRAAYRNDSDGARFGVNAWTGTVTSEPLAIDVVMGVTQGRE
jgi:hypothetical protein